MKEKIDPNVYRLLQEGTGFKKRQLNYWIKVYGVAAVIVLFRPWEEAKAPRPFWIDLAAYYRWGSILTIEGIFKKHGVEYLNENKG